MSYVLTTVLPLELEAKRLVYLRKLKARLAKDNVQKAIALAFHKAIKKTLDEQALANKAKLDTERKERLSKHEQDLDDNVLFTSDFTYGNSDDDLQKGDNKLSLQELDQYEEDIRVEMLDNLVDSYGDYSEDVLYAILKLSPLEQEYLHFVKYATFPKMEMIVKNGKSVIINSN